jgi:DNA mismatch endonuclease (patch repair protein)
MEKAGCRLRHQPVGIIGKPDYANKSRKVAVFIHGYFFHACPLHGNMPKTNKEFWEGKLGRMGARYK